MSASQLRFGYLVASVCLIVSLKGVSAPGTARRGNLFGMAGMALAVLFTVGLIWKGRLDLVIIAMLVGGAAGATVARRVQMTPMPELVAAMHSLVGMAAGLVPTAAGDKPRAFRGARPPPARQNAVGV